MRNRQYIGEICHKGKSWPGEHAPIVDPEIFNRVQERLLPQRRFRLADRAKSWALLLGKIFNDAGERMTPSYAMKQGVRYRYYISVSAMQSRERPSQSVHRIPAAPVEAIVIKALATAEGIGAPPMDEGAATHADGVADESMSNDNAHFPEPEAEHASRDLVDRRSRTHRHTSEPHRDGLSKTGRRRRYITNALHSMDQAVANTPARNSAGRIWRRRDPSDGQRPSGSDCCAPSPWRGCG